MRYLLLTIFLASCTYEAPFTVPPMPPLRDTSLHSTGRVQNLAVIHTASSPQAWLKWTNPEGYTNAGLWVSPPAWLWNQYPGSRFRTVFEYRQVIEYSLDLTNWQTVAEIPYVTSNAFPLTQEGLYRVGIKLHENTSLY